MEPSGLRFTAASRRANEDFDHQDHETLPWATFCLRHRLSAGAARCDHKSLFSRFLRFLLFTLQYFEWRHTSHECGSGLAFAGWEAKGVVDRAIPQVPLRRHSFRYPCSRVLGWLVGAAFRARCVDAISFGHIIANLLVCFTKAASTARSPRTKSVGRTFAVPLFIRRARSSVGAWRW